jgi:hypothetical protein
MSQFVPAEAKKKRKINRDGFGYKKGKVSGTIYKIIRINIKADAKGDSDEREVFRLNDLNGINQNQTRLKATAPYRPDTFFKEDTEQLIDSSKEEYIHKYWGGKGRQIRVGDSIKFHNHDTLLSRDEDIEGKVSRATPFTFWLNNVGYYYRNCTNIKVKHNGFFVDGFFFPKIKF